jgi:hypothetical protein
MKKLATLLLLTSLTAVGCTQARPGEWGWTPAYTAEENGHIINRNWDYEGKQLVDDIDYVMLWDQPSHLTIWNVR